MERFIKTIKSRIWHHIRATNSRRYIDVLPQLTNSYNNSWHSGIQSEPVNVTKKNESKLWWQMYWPKFNDLKTKNIKRNFTNKYSNNQNKLYAAITMKNPNMKIGSKNLLKQLRKIEKGNKNILLLK